MMEKPEDIKRDLRGRHYLARVKLERMLEQYPKPNKWQALAIRDATNRLKLLNQRMKEEGLLP